MGFKHQIVTNEDGESTLTVYVPGEKPVIARGDDPNYSQIESIAKRGNSNDTKKLIGLAAPGIGVETRFKELSDRVAVRGGNIYFDGDVLNDSLADHIVRCLSDEGDWKPLVKFLEKVHMNPSKNSREQLHNWLKNRFTINADGNIIMYKGVESDGNGGYRSKREGTAIVDGVEVKGKVPNKIGSVVTMPRSSVADNPSAACSTGLHVATHDFAKSFAGYCFKVEVDPRDVVSVPGYDTTKVRVCRYKVLDFAKQEDIRPIARDKTKPPTKKVQTKGTGIVAKTRDELRKLAAQLGIEGRGRMSKSQLEQAVSKNQVASMTRDDLRKEAARLNIDGRGRMSKTQLQHAVAKAQRA
jgi:hypothetical protein